MLTKLATIAPEENFRWRGGEITRLEAFSDAVFAFSVTLLVVSLEVPRNFRDLIEAMRGFVPFAICFGSLAQLWFAHYLYFRRYGLQNGRAVVLNCLLLFCVLFFVYPLKFLFSGVLLGGGFRLDEARLLLVIYGGGYAGVVLILAALYAQAWGLRERLELDSLERFVTWRTLIDNLVMAAIALISILLAWLAPPAWLSLAGYFYLAIPVYFLIVGTAYARRVRRLRAARNTL